MVAWGTKNSWLIFGLQSNTAQHNLAQLINGYNINSVTTLEANLFKERPENCMWCVVANPAQMRGPAGIQYYQTPITIASQYIVYVRYTRPFITFVYIRIYVYRVHVRVHHKKMHVLTMWSRDQQRKDM